MGHSWKIFWIVSLLIAAVTVQARPVNINAVRYQKTPESARLIFDVSNEAAHDVFMLNNPSRLVIDFNDAYLTKKLVQPDLNHPLFLRLRSAKRNGKDLRVVVDLKKRADPKSFFLTPHKNYGHRLVVDLFDKGTQSLATKIKPSKVQTVTKTVKNKVRDVIVAVDAGHGGKDPGAHGRHGTQEKEVVFSIAQKLARLINQQPGMKAVMVRKGDYYIKLRRRMQIAREAKADLFVSIHADAFKNSRVKGASVFTLSRRGASSEAARWLAKHENAADLVGGVSLDDKDDVLATVLLDLSQTATQEASRDLASKVLHNFGNIGPLHKDHVQKAGFMVLKSPDIPSILVETAFISNPSEERKLRSNAHQDKMARSIFNGIKDYFKQNAPVGTIMASTRHVISRGDTLSGIAQQYGVSMKQLKMANSIKNNNIIIGQVLTIPSDS